MNLAILWLTIALIAQQSPVEKIGDQLFRVGTARVDMAKHEVSVPGKVNDAKTLEFIACTKRGTKAYESAIELDTTAVLLNTALLLTGLDKAKGVPTKFHFDPNPPQGDPLEITVEWEGKDGHHSMPAEDIIWNSRTKATMAAGRWVYTGSVILPDGKYLADVDGVIVGFVHTPAPIIERTTFEKTDYGTVVLNPNIGLTPGMAVRMIFRALPKSGDKR